jgi:hypothetical protein
LGICIHQRPLWLHRSKHCPLSTSLSTKLYNFTIHSYRSTLSASLVAGSSVGYRKIHSLNSRLHRHGSCVGSMQAHNFRLDRGRHEGDRSNFQPPILCSEGGLCLPLTGQQAVWDLRVRSCHSSVRWRQPPWTTTK